MIYTGLEALPGERNNPGTAAEKGRESQVDRARYGGVIPIGMGAPKQPEDGARCVAATTSSTKGGSTRFRGARAWARSQTPGREVVEYLVSSPSISAI